MSFDNFYPNRKDKRKIFYKPKSIDKLCRNHGLCSYCISNRTFIRNEITLQEEMKLFYLDKYSIATGNYCINDLPPN